MGKYEGIQLLKTSMKDAYSARNKAENASQVAMALSRTGKSDEARKYLQLARQLDPKCPLLNRAEKVVSSLASQES